MTRPVSVIVLAAGESRRMGTQKALLEWEGVPLIEYQLRQIADVPEISETIVVTGHAPEGIEETASRYGGRCVRNERYREGRSTSIIAGLGGVSADADAVLIMAVDQPRASAVLRTIIEAGERSGAGIVVPVHEGRRGHPPLFAGELLTELRAINEASQGLRAVMLAHAADIHEVACDASVLVDLNTPEDVARNRAASEPA